MKFAARLLCIYFIVCLQLACSNSDSGSSQKSSDNDPLIDDLVVDDRLYYSALNLLTIGVADLDVALDLWVGHFGMNILASKEGPDTDLARLWNLKPEDIERQAILRTNESPTGMLHFVQFNNPDEPVRKGAQNFDLVPKNLDIYVKDLPAMVDKLRAAGSVFRTETYSEFTATDGTVFREIHMPSHDFINVVLLEVVGKTHDYSEKGVSALGPFVFIVPDVEAESEFFESAFLLDKLNDNVFSGPEIEKVVGLPKGTVLKILIWGREGFDLGEWEIIEYQGVESNNLYTKAKPKAPGILQAAYTVPDFQPLKARLKSMGVDVTEHGTLNTLVGQGEVISFSSPAGLKIEVYQQNSSEE